MQYLIVFVLSCFFAHMAVKSEKKGNKRNSKFFSFLAIILPCVLAGLRSLNIGTDVKVYVIYSFRIAEKSSSFFNYINSIDVEFLYGVLNYIVSRFTSNINIFLFIIQLIMTTLVYKQIYSERERVPIVLSYSAYFTFLFPRFLNLVRQGIAVCIIIYAFKYIKEKNIWKYILCVIIASLFHSTAIFALPIYFIYNMYVNKEKSKKVIIIHLSYIILIVLILFLDYKDIMRFLINIYILPEKFNNYVTKYSIASNFDFLTTFYKTTWIVCIVVFIKKSKINYKEFKFYMSMLIIDLLLWNLNYKIKNGERLSYYYGAIAFLNFLPFLPQYFKGKKNLGYVIYFVLLFGYWIWKFIYLNSGEIFPYIMI